MEGGRWVEGEEGMEGGKMEGRRWGGGRGGGREGWEWGWKSGGGNEVSVRLKVDVEFKWRVISGPVVRHVRSFDVHMIAPT